MSTSNAVSVASVVATIGTVTAGAANIIAIAASIETDVEAAKVIYGEVVSYMDAYLANNKLTGASKKEIVIQMIKDSWVELTTNHTAVQAQLEAWVQKIGLFIDKAYSAYKASVELGQELTKLLKGVTHGTSTTTTA